MDQFGDEWTSLGSAQSETHERRDEIQKLQVEKDLNSWHFRRISDHEMIHSCSTHLLRTILQVADAKLDFLVPRAGIEPALPLPENGF